MSGLRVIAAIAFSLVMILSGLCALVKARDELHFLDYSEDNYKVVFMSDNLTAAVTYSWPRVVFEHSEAMLSPSFEVGFSRFYLYNDTDSDGTFNQSETTYVGYLDENHVTWNFTSVQFFTEPDPGEYAVFRMKTTVSLYPGLLNETVVVPDWANITFYFRINENNVTHENSRGGYEYVGMEEMEFNFTLDISKPLNVSGIVMEQSLKGGGSTYLFLLMQSGSHGNIVYDHVSGRVDEKALYGENYSHEFFETSLPTQNVYFAKDDGTVQAFFKWDSEPKRYTEESQSLAPMNATFYTTGAGLELLSAFALTSNTTGLYFEGSVGIDEEGFTVRVRDWLEDNYVSLIIFISAVVLIVLASYGVVLMKRKRSAAKEKEQEVEKPKTQG